MTIQTAKQELDFLEKTKQLLMKTIQDEAFSIDDHIFLTANKSKILQVINRTIEGEIDFLLREPDDYMELYDSTENTRVNWFDKLLRMLIKANAKLR